MSDDEDRDVCGDEDTDVHVFIRNHRGIVEVVPCKTRDVALSYFVDRAKLCNDFEKYGVSDASDRCALILAMIERGEPETALSLAKEAYEEDIVETKYEIISTYRREEELCEVKPVETREKYWKTTVVVEVLSKGERPPEWTSLSDLEDSYINGDNSGTQKCCEHEIVTREEMRDLLEAQGSDPNFLDCDEE